MPKKDSFRMGTSDTPLCDCSKADESVEHCLLHCENYTEARKVMLHTVEDLVPHSSNSPTTLLHDEGFVAGLLSQTELSTQRASTDAGVNTSISASI